MAKSEGDADGCTIPEDALSAADWIVLREPGTLADTEPGGRRLRSRAW